MGFLNNQLNKRYDFNFKERAYVLGGGIAGAISPIIATRYLVFPESENLGQDLFAWGTSTAISIIPMIFTVPMGVAIGTLSAFNSKQKRMNKQENKLEEKAIGGKK